MARLLLIGPMPPPFGGTTVSFSTFVDYARAHKRNGITVEILDTTSRRNVPRASLLAYLQRTLTGMALAMSTAFQILRADSILLFGSQRFVTFFGIFVVLIAKPLRKPIAIRIFGGAYDVYLAKKTFPCRYIITSLLNNADAILVQTDHLYTALAPSWPQKIAKVHNYRRVPEHSPRSMPLHRNVRFIYAAALVQEKGIGILLQAFTLLCDRLVATGSGIVAHLDVFGTGPFCSSIGPSTSTVRFHGEVPNHDYIKHLVESDIFVLPTFWPTEGHSGAVIEAMLHGVPVITTKWRALPELVVDGENGLLCKPRDVESLVNAMYYLCTHPSAWLTMSKHARLRSLNFGVETVCPELIRLAGLADYFM